MKTKIVYAVTSDENDVYIDQLIFSIQTLKYHNPDARVCIIVDDITNSLICNERMKVFSFVDEKIIIETPDNFDKKARSRFVKTQVRQHVKGAFLFIDTDTIITADLSSIDNFTFDVAACLDRHLPLSRHQMKNSIIAQMKSSGFYPDEKDDLYFNSGVMFVNDTPNAYKLYEQWHMHWFKSHLNGTSIDQPALAMSNKKMGYIIQELPHTWNCQILGNGLKYVNEAKIVHYFNANTRTKMKNYPYLLTKNDVFLFFRSKEYKQDDLVEMAATMPCALFCEKYEMLSDDTLEAYYTDAYLMLYYICGFHNRLFSLINGLCKAIFRLSRK